MADPTFPKTKKSLEDLIDLLRCSRCSSASTKDIYMSPCDHKHCASCLKTGGNCGICKTKLNRKDAIPDLLSSQILEKLLEFKCGLYNNTTEKQRPKMEENRMDFGTTVDDNPGKYNNDDDDMRSVSDIFSQNSPKPIDDEADNAEINIVTEPKASRPEKLSAHKSLVLKPPVADLSSRRSNRNKSKVVKSSEAALKNEVKIGKPRNASKADREALGTEVPAVNLGSSPPVLTQQSGISIKNCTPSPQRGEKPAPTLTPYTPPPTGLPKKRILVATRSKSARNGNHSETRGVMKSGTAATAEVTTPTTPVTPLVRNRRTKLSSEGSIKSSASSVTSSFGSCSSPASLEKRNAKGETALHVAARIGKIDRIKSLIDAGANVNARDFAGWTPLHEAVNGKSDNVLQVVTMLCEAGSQISAPGMANETPLHEASRLGVNSIINLILSYGADKNARNKSGQIPGDVSKSEEVKLLIENFSGPVTRRCEVIDPGILFNEEKFLIYFTYSVKADELDLFKTEFGPQIATELSGDVTHVIFDTTEVQPGESQPLTLNYLAGLLSGAWLLSSKWVVDSLLGKRLLEPNGYEIQSPLNYDARDDLGAGDVRKRARTNRELGNPGLFQGMNFYLYKNCSKGEMKKKDLAKLITIGDGVVINRDPNPDTVDPLENPTRFHAKDPSNKMILASHVILFSPESCPGKKHNMEHVKTLKVDWLIQSVLRFSLQDPDNFIA